MRTDPHATHARLVARLPVPLALVLWVVPAWGQVTATTTGGAPGSQSASTEAAAPEGAPGEAADPNSPDAPQAATQTATPAATPGIGILARWVRSSAGRMCFKLVIDSETRISTPERESEALGWRISLPHFDRAHIVMPPAGLAFHARTEPAPATEPVEATAAVADEH